MTPQQLVNAVRSKDPMRGLCASKQITDEGCDWLKFALDPFHDLQLDNLKGYPDVNTEPTVIVKVRQAIEISAPKGLQDGKNWDCHIALSPIDWAKPNGLVEGTTNTPVASWQGYNCPALIKPQGAPTLEEPAGFIDFVGPGYTPPNSAQRAACGRVDGLVINSVPADATAGADMTFTPGHMPYEAEGGYQVQNINLDNYLDFDKTDLGVYRIVYSGFEVVNTTAQIHKQGAVTVYEYGHSYEMSQLRGYSDDIPSGVPPTVPYPLMDSKASNTFRSPPNTIAEAKIMPGSHTWPAQEGCYCTAKFLGENPFQAATMRNYVIQQNNPSAPKSSGYNQAFQNGEHTMGSIVSTGIVGNHFPVRTPQPGSLGLRSAYLTAPATHFSHMSTAGAYFTGLSPETTLFVTWRVGLERLPAANKPTFLALAQPSATYDPNALTLYNLIANHLPPGCPQGWNDLGRWFNTIANVAKTVIPAAFPLVQTAQMILNGLGAVNAARALPMAASAAKAVAAAARGNATARQVRAVTAIQGAQRRRKAGTGQKPAVQNFGAPGARRAQRVQQFSQMSGAVKYGY